MGPTLHKAAAQTPAHTTGSIKGRWYGMMQSRGANATSRRLLEPRLAAAFALKICCLPLQWAAVTIIVVSGERHQSSTVVEHVVGWPMSDGRRDYVLSQHHEQWSLVLMLTSVV